MRRGGGHAKGSNFEREVCVSLSKAVSHGARNDLYWRTAMSGGRATVMKRRGQLNRAQIGDITSIDHEGRWLTDRYVFECKHLRDVRLVHFILNNAGPIREFWNKGEPEALDIGREFVLIAKENRIETLVFMRGPCIEGPRLAVAPNPLVLFPHGIMMLTLVELLRCIRDSNHPTRRRIT